ncbi:hypothetical protein LSAT2_019572 [Lamellibrachia satsuma]|nr:hypothetical protein LSAT2_019572 [Lamellibrachia satsuma]
MIATALEMVIQHKLYKETNPNHHIAKTLIFGRYLSSSRMDGVILEQTAAPTGMTIHPVARSAADIDNMNNAVRSSRSCEYRVGWSAGARAARVVQHRNMRQQSQHRHRVWKAALKNRGTLAYWELLINTLKMATSAILCFAITIALFAMKTRCRSFLREGQEKIEQACIKEHTWHCPLPLDNDFSEAVSYKEWIDGIHIIDGFPEPGKIRPLLKIRRDIQLTVSA